MSLVSSIVSCKSSRYVCCTNNNIYKRGGTGLGVGVTATESSPVGQRC